MQSKVAAGALVSDWSHMGDYTVILRQRALYYRESSGGGDVVGGCLPDERVLEHVSRLDLSPG